ncbi:MAG: TrkH family potassium uptake protein [Chloroflexota bacterium]
MLRPSLPWRMTLGQTRHRRGVAFSPLTLVYMFAALVVVGALVLRLPAASASGQDTGFVDALFTSTSAVCVTGLVVVDTGTQWSFFGQAVILLLIQIGGFGFMTSATLLLLAFRRRVGLKERLLAGEAMGLSTSGGIVTLIRRMAVFTLLLEVAGAVVLLFRFQGEGGVWRALFHSVSAFNNAGFDLFGGFRSMTGFTDDLIVVLVTGLLLVLGGLSYVVLADVATRKRFRDLAVDTKFVLVATASLLGIGFVVVLASEAGNPATLGLLDWPDKISCALFQAATPRTAGFTTIEIAAMRDHALLFLLFLMFVGGATGSTAGGIKVNTFSLLVAALVSTLRGKERPTAYGAEFEAHTVYRALSVVILSFLFVGAVAVILTAIEDVPAIDMVFESVSAFGTVGLSTGVTPSLSVAGRLIISATMFVGRLGPLYVALALVQSRKARAYHFPVEPVRIG